ncbi:hypothetical protein DOY81_010725 [Sarcophaga bullata]|nr:hypothetical protein DOY81_010725 [Sarcophaga bullata]
MKCLKMAILLINVNIQIECSQLQIHQNRLKAYYYKFILLFDNMMSIKNKKKSNT